MSRIRFGLLLSLCALQAFSLTARANVFPSNLFQSANTIDANNGGTITFSYLLNEAATTANVEVVDGSNNVVRTISGATAKGTHSVVWDGKDDFNQKLNSGSYSFRVATQGTARATWSRIDTESVLTAFELPRGVAVNNNPDSPYYGRAYVSVGRVGTTGASAGSRAVSDGLYMMNADQTATGISEGTGPHTGGVDWTTGGIVSPYRIQVGPDDSVYVTDWSDSHSGLWQAPANLGGSWTEVLDSSDRGAGGLGTTHGSISDVVVTGTGASRTIYTIDEDLVPGGGSTGSIPRYAIGNDPTFSGAPSGYAYVDGLGAANRVQNFQASIALDNNGNFWLSQHRAGGAADTVPALMQIDSTGAVVWSSVPDLVANTLTDPFRNMPEGGIAYDPVNNVLALVTSQTSAQSGAQGNIIIFDPNTKAIIARFPFNTLTAGLTNTDVAFDNVGNLYAVNRSSERLRIWAPPNGDRYVGNASTTNSLGPLGSIHLIGVPEPTSLVLVAMALVGLAVGRRR